MPQIQHEMLLRLPVCGGDSSGKVLAVHMGKWEKEAQGPHEACWSCALLESWGAYGEIAGGNRASLTLSGWLAWIASLGLAFMNEIQSYNYGQG